jgi:hypothetical protein
VDVTPDIPDEFGTFATANTLVVNFQNAQTTAGYTTRFTSNVGAFDQVSFLYTDLQQAPGMPDFTVNYYTAAGTLIQSTILPPDKAWDGGSGTATSNGALFCSGVLSQPAAYFTIAGAGDAFGVDNLTFSVPGTQASVASGGSTLDTTPTIIGTLSRALVGGETVHVFRDGTDLGPVATVAGTNWNYTDSVGAGTNHTYTAQIFSAGTGIATSNAYAVKVLASPLVLDLNGDGVHTVAAADGVSFDLLGTGHVVQTGWVDAHDGLLAIDLNGNETIDSGIELFGQASILANGSVAHNGWAALAEYDFDLDGKISASDAQFANLMVWQDINHDGMSEAGELKHLSELGIASINLATGFDKTVEQNGNTLTMYSSYTTVDGSTHEIVDAYFATQEPTTSVEATAADESLNGTFGSDAFTWTLADAGTARAPAADTINGFDSSPTGDKLDLRDLLVGEHSDLGNLANFVHLSVRSGTTKIEISSSGGFTGGVYSAGAVDQTITLTGVDLKGGFTTDNQIINDLLSHNKLIVDH